MGEKENENIQSAHSDEASFIYHVLFVGLCCKLEHSRFQHIFIACIGGALKADGKYLFFQFAPILCIGKRYCVVLCVRFSIRLRLIWYHWLDDTEITQREFAGSLINVDRSQWKKFEIFSRKTLAPHKLTHLFLRSAYAVRKRSFSRNDSMSHGLIWD